jgi:hypothetical protein
MGQPRLLDHELAQKLRTAVSVGASLADAGSAYGISKATMYRWRKHGRDEARRRDEGGVPDPDLDLLVQFSDDLDRAQGEAKVEALTIVRQFALGVEKVETTTRTRDVVLDGQVVTLRETVEKKTVERAWQPAAWFLERRFPAEFALKNRLEVTGEDGGPVQVEERAARIAAEAAAYTQGVRDTEARAGQEP